MYNRLKKSCKIVALCAGMLVLNSSVWAEPIEVTPEPIEINLETAIQMALENNPKTKIADGNLKNALGSKKQVIGQFGPQVSFQHTSRRHQTYQAINTAVMNTFTDSVNFSYPLYTGGKRKGSVDASRRGVEIAELEIDRADQEVKLDATTAFYDVLQTRNLVKLNKESVERLELHLKNVQAQFDVGVVAKVDVLRSEVELADAQQELIKAENSHEIALANLNNTIGLNLDTQIAVSEELTYEEYLKTMEYCLDYSLEHRPEILQAEKSVQAAKSNIMSARSGYIPTINLVASHGWANDRFPGDEKNDWNVSAVVNINIFDSQTTRGAVDAAQGNLVQREATYKQTKDSVALQVRSNYLNLREAEKRIDTSSVTVEKAKEDYKIALVRYQAGVGTNTDVLDAQVALTKAETNYIQALYDYNTSRAKLENSMGVSVNAIDE